MTVFSVFSQAQKKKHDPESLLLVQHLLIKVLLKRDAESDCVVSWEINIAIPFVAWTPLVDCNIGKRSCSFVVRRTIEATMDVVVAPLPPPPQNDDEEDDCCWS